MKEEVKKVLLSNQDSKYKDFSFELNLYHKHKSIGVRIPILRNYAKELSRKYELDYLLENIDEEYYEEILLKGFIIGEYKKLSFNELVIHIDNHINKITDWSMCDTFAASLKITNKYQKEIWDYLQKKLNSKKEFTVRFALVMILDYYINDEYKDKIYHIIQNVNNDAYYVKMANAWLLSYMFIKCFNDTINFINHNKIDKWTLSKGISKACESFRISQEEKNILKKIQEHVKEKD